MTNTSSVPAEPTGAVAPTEQSEELIGGKFKTADELLAAYQELEAKMGKKDEAPAPEETPAAAEADETGYVPPTEAKTDEDRQYEVETYGKELAEVFDKAGLNAKHVSQFYHENGKFPESAYKALEEQGVSRSAVDNYLSGSADKASQNAEMAQADVKEIKDTIGGEAEYTRLMQWASKTLTAAEAEEFNSVLAQGKAATKFAVQALYARYTATHGTPEPKTYGGKSGGPDTVGRYNSRDEMLSDMRDPRYTSGDPAFHNMVRQKLANSSIFQAR